MVIHMEARKHGAPPGAVVSMWRARGGGCNFKDAEENKTKKKKKITDQKLCVFYVFNILQRCICSFLLLASRP